MSKRPVSRQQSISNFLATKNSKPEDNSITPDRHFDAKELCPTCKDDASGSCHMCFVCKRPGHAFCCKLEIQLEGYGKPILCLECSNCNK